MLNPETPFPPTPLLHGFLANLEEMIFVVGPSGSLLYFNRAVALATGYTVDELSGLRASDLLAEYNRQERAELRAEIENGPLNYVRAILVRKDGSTFPVESRNYLMNWRGHRYNFAMARDITRKTEIEASVLSKIALLSARDNEIDSVLPTKVNIVGASRALRNVKERAKKVARANRPVLITGETGSGKDLFAHFIHQHSKSKHERMITANCADFNGELAHSYLFGHVKGAFTGAHSDRDGLFATANGGTLFLDEIGELSLSVQAQLLRVLNDGSYTRLGEDCARKTNVRLVMATHRNLEKLVRKSLFREDLFYRISVLDICIPPLRHRPYDIPLLVTYQLSRLNSDNGTDVGTYEDGDMAILSAYSYPGNVRELFSIVQKSYCLGVSCMNRLTLIPEIKEKFRARLETIDAVPLNWKQMEIMHIHRALRLSEGKVSGPNGAAMIVGLPESTFRGKMRKYGL